MQKPQLTNLFTYTTWKQTHFKGFGLALRASGLCQLKKVNKTNISYNLILVGSSFNKLTQILSLNFHSKRH